MALIEETPTLNINFNLANTPEKLLSMIKTWGGTFTRGSETIGETLSASTYTDNLGILRQPEVGYPRPNFVAGVNKGILIEEQRTNNVTNSDTSTYTVGSSLSSEVVTLMGLDALKVTVNTGNGFAGTANQRINPPSISYPVAVGDKVCMSWIIRIDGNSNRFSAWLFGASYRLEFNNQDITSQSVTYSFTTGFTNTFWKSTQLADNIYKIEFGGESTVADTITQLNSAPYTTGEPMTVLAPQLEAGSFATSYIPTAGAAVTRGAERLKDASATGKINQAEGTLAVEVDVRVFPLAGSPVTGIMTLQTGADNLNNCILLGFERQSGGTNRVYCIIQSGGSATTILFGTAISAGVYRIVLAYKKDNYALYVNGVQIATSSSGNLPVGTMSEIYYGTRRLTDTVFFNDPIKYALLIPIRLPNETLQLLSRL